MSRTESATDRPTAKASASSRFVAPLLVFIVLALTVLVLWDMASDGARKPRATSPPPPLEAATVAATTAEPDANAEVAADGIRIKPAGSEESTEDEPMHPHPIDETRRRIYRENNLNGAMMGAMNVGDYQGLRALVEEYRMDYPEDEYRLQEGYSIIADCLEKLTPERQGKAREYWKAKRGSTVRRFIRRHCLDKPVADE